MPSSRYTNAVLTVIALCLVYQCIKGDAVPSTAAVIAPKPPPAPAVQKMQIVGTPTVRVEGKVEAIASIEGTTRVAIASMPSLSIVNLPGFPSQPIEVKLVDMRPVPIEIKNTPVPIDIEDTDTLPVEIRNYPSVPVEVKNLPR